MEQIQSHDIKDVYRIKEGVLLEVSKYDYIEKGYVGYSLDSKKKKIVRGCKGLTMLKEEYTNFDGVVFPEGTYVYSNVAVFPVTDPNLFKFDIKSSGGSIYGDAKELSSVLSTIQKIIDSYFK